MIQDLPLSYVFEEADRYRQSLLLATLNSISHALCNQIAIRYFLLEGSFLSAFDLCHLCQQIRQMQGYA